MEKYLNGKRLGDRYLDTFVDPSWYFLRFCPPKKKDYGHDIEELNIGCL